jgi:hypothetical protein
MGTVEARLAEEPRRKGRVSMLRPKLTYANVMVTLLAFLVLGGGAAYAATQVAENSVGARQLRQNAVTASKLAPQSVGNEALTKAIRTKLDSAGSPGAPGQAGAPGAPGTPGAAGPGAVRLHLSATAAQSASPLALGSVGPLTLKGTCLQEEGKTSLSFVINATEAGTIQENFQVDSGSTPEIPGEPDSGNLQIDLPTGETTLGGPPGVPSGTYFRTIASLVFTTANQTVSINFASVADGSAAHCTADGVGVVASG